MPANFLSKGCQGHAVTRIQNALNQRMLPPVNMLTVPPLEPLVPDGDFGTRTDKMVREFQRLNQISPDGIVGPVTRLHLFPYVKFKSVLKGKGEFRSRGPVYEQAAQRGRTPAFALQTVGGDPPKKEPDKPQGFRFELFIAAGIEKGFKLSDKWPPRWGPAEQTLTLGAVLLRSGSLEISGELEASRHLRPKREGPLQRQEAWQWDGSIKATFEAISPVGPFSPLSPFVKIAPLAPLPVSVGIGAELVIAKEVLKLSVDFQLGAGYDWDRGEVTRGGAIGSGLEFNLDIFFGNYPPSKP